MTNRTFLLALTLLLAAVTASCAAELDDDDSESGMVQSELRQGRLFDRVVIGRMYQRERWTLPAADNYRPAQYPTRVERRAHYVCDALVRLDPTYVSGLVRLEADTEITDDMAQTFRIVKSCVRAGVGHPVRFDVVLNALHYTDANEVRSADEGGAALRQRLQEANRLLRPEAWFFDFYTVPFNATEGHYYPDGMRQGIQWIHAHNQIVGGNVWGRSVPTGTDFASVTSRDGLDHVSVQIDGLGGTVPVLMHIRNDPHIAGTEGLAWMHRDTDYRRRLLNEHARGQAQRGYKYMYPAFFPMDEAHMSYDVTVDGNMMSEMREVMADYNPTRYR